MSLNELRAKLFLINPLEELGNKKELENHIKGIISYLKKNNFSEDELHALSILGRYTKQR